MRKYTSFAGCVAFLAVAALTSGSAWAADSTKKAPAMKPVVEPWNPWMIRLRTLVVEPEDSGKVDQIAGSGLKNSTSTVPELDVSYFFTPNVAAELILGVTRHHVTGTGTITGVDVGKATLLPPTLTLQYHFTNFGAFKPYVGAGPNYTVFFNQKAAGGVVTAVKFKNTFGFALQAGFDYMIDRHWGLNVDVKKLFLEPDFNATIGGLARTGTDNLNPWLISGGVTYKF